MKRICYYLIFALAIILASCGNQGEGVTNTDNVEKANTEEQAGNATDDTDKYEPTTDPMIAGNKNEDKNYLEMYNEVWEVTGWYKTEGTDKNGFNHIEKDGVKIDYALVSVHSVSGGDAIAALGEIQNKSKESVHLNGFDNVLTDQGDQSYIGGFVGDLMPGAKKKLMGYTDPFDYGMPKEWIETDSPVVWINQENEGIEEEYIFDGETRLKFTKE